MHHHIFQYLIVHSVISSIISHTFLITISYYPYPVLESNFAPKSEIRWTLPKKIWRFAWKPWWRQTWHLRCCSRRWRSAGGWKWRLEMGERSDRNRCFNGWNSYNLWAHPEIEVFHFVWAIWQNNLRRHLRPWNAVVPATKHCIVLCVGLFQELVQSWQQRQVTDDVDTQMHPAESLGCGLPTNIEWASPNQWAY